MCKYLLMAVCSMCIGIGICAGQSSWKFRSDNYVGVVTGELAAGGELQTINGLYKGPWFVGVGGGMDNYRFRSVPLFLSIARELTPRGSRGAAFVFADGGFNVPWYKRQLTNFQESEVISSRFHAGPWGSAGLGYKWRISTRGDKAVLLSMGYSMKKLRETLVGIPECMNCQVVATQQTYYYEYDNNTLVLMVGFRF